MTQQKFAFRPRKVFALNGSWAITLPQDWAHAQQLHFGDALSVELAPDGALVIKKGES